jgi:G6PDH family F420-dependent oxidoreductase
MPEIGYALSSEEHPPGDLVENARRAEEAGFAFALISDHFHPWTERQGHSGFVWSVIGAIAASTRRLRLGTGVTCPTMRIHPAIIAQAAATSACMMPGRFFLGVGTGENLNEHILGNRWPSVYERLEMLEEAVAVIRRLWEGEQVNFQGRYYKVTEARIYDLPSEETPIYVGASGKAALQLAGQIGDGLISTAPDPTVVEAFEKAGGEGKPCYAMAHVCWAQTDTEAVKIAHEWWPNSSLKGDMGVELPLPRHFEQAAQLVDEEDVKKTVLCSSDPQKHIARVKEYVEAGFDHVYLHQVGPDQRGFMDFYADQILPEF